MSTDIKVGQVWRDKDKRRNTVIEIIDIGDEDGENTEVLGLVTGTEEERWYKAERLQKRWELIRDKKYHAFHDFEQSEAAVGYDTREGWLRVAAECLRENVFAPLGHEVPEVRVSVGWPGGKGPKAGTIGQCWQPSSTGDGVGQIFISPILSDPLIVLATLAHEMVHAINHKNGETGHRGSFKRIGEEIGLEGKMATSVAGEALTAKLEVIAEALGPFPHSPISVADKPKVQKTYLLKYVSPHEPDYFLRITQTKIEEYGAPRDPWGNEMEQEL